MFNVIDHASGWKIDFILRKHRLFSEQEFEQRRAMSLLGFDVFMASAETRSSRSSSGSSRAAARSVSGRDVAGMVATVGDDLQHAEEHDEQGKDYEGVRASKRQLDDPHGAAPTSKAYAAGSGRTSR
jgi:hypothetical protein